MAKQRRCYLCNTKISARYTFCKACTQKYELYKVPLALWPTWARNVKRMLDREWVARQRSRDVETDTEEGRAIADRAIAIAHFRRDMAKTLPLDVCLAKYRLTLDEFDILTEKAKLLAPRMGVTRSTIYNRRKRLKKRVLAEGILQPTKQ